MGVLGYVRGFKPEERHDLCYVEMTCGSRGRQGGTWQVEKPPEAGLTPGLWLELPGGCRAWAGQFPSGVQGGMVGLGRSGDDVVREGMRSAESLLSWGQTTATNDSLSPCPVKVLAIEDLGSFVHTLFYPDPD